MIVIDGCHVATVDAVDTEHATGHVVLDGPRITGLGAGPAPDLPGAERIDGAGLLVTPGLVNIHHHLYQWITRGYATDDTLFGWLTTLYPVWARLDAELVHDSAAANLAWMALTGTTTSTDQHYVFPAGAGDLLEAEITAARRIGLRFHPSRGSMNLGASRGGLPPDAVVEDHDVILAATEAAIGRWHEPGPDAMVRIAVAPCSPFSVTAELMRDSAALARRAGVRMHTHLAETVDEEEFCRQTFGATPVEYAEDLGWLGEDEWLAHCVHLSDAAIARFASTGTGVAHCPTSNARLGSGIARVRDLLNAGVPVGLGVDGAASNESGRMVDELHQALLAARFRLGRDGELGTLEVGKLADVAVWRVDGLAGNGIADPVCTLVFGAPALAHLFVGGASVVRDGELRTADAETLAAAAGRAAARLSHGAAGFVPRRPRTTRSTPTAAMAASRR